MFTRTAVSYVQRDNVAAARAKDQMWVFRNVMLSCSLTGITRSWSPFTGTIELMFDAIATMNEAETLALLRDLRRQQAECDELRAILMAEIVARGLDPGAHERASPQRRPT